MIDCFGKFLMLKEHLKATTHEDETRFDELHLEEGSIVMFLGMNKQSQHTPHKRWTVLSTYGIVHLYFMSNYCNPSDWICE